MAVFLLLISWICLSHSAVSLKFSWKFNRHTRHNRHTRQLTHRSPTRRTDIKPSPGSSKYYYYPTVTQNNNASIHHTVDIQLKLIITQLLISITIWLIYISTRSPHNTSRSYQNQSISSALFPTHVLQIASILPQALLPASFTQQRLGKFHRRNGLIVLKRVVLVGGAV